MAGIRWNDWPDTVEYALEEQITRIRDLNPSLKAFVYHSMANTNPMVRKNERDEFLSYASEFPALGQLKSMNYYRKVYRDVIPMGLSVLEAGNEQAKSEINAFIDEMMEVLGK